MALLCYTSPAYLVLLWAFVEISITPLTLDARSNDRLGILRAPLFSSSPPNLNVQHRHHTKMPVTAAEMAEVRRRAALAFSMPIRTKKHANGDQQRTRSRSPTRRDDRYRSRSRSRDAYRSSRRDRSPPNGHHESGDRYSSSYDRTRAAPPSRSYEERQESKEQMMSSLRDNSQQDHRVYVGNLSYDVKWHHLKDFMRKGKLTQKPQITTSRDANFPHSW